MHGWQSRESIQDSIHNYAVIGHQGHVMTGSLTPGCSGASVQGIASSLPLTKTISGLHNIHLFARKTWKIVEEERAMYPG